MSIEYQEFTRFPKGFYPPLIEKIYEENQEVLALYPNAAADLDFDNIIQKKNGFQSEIRQTLSKVLEEQYAGFEENLAIRHIELLQRDNTFTVTTGQQIHVFLGPMYVLYKALSAIDLAKKIQNKYPEINVVPVFWMATEDHDVEEIRGLSIFGKSFTWDTAQKGPVGRFNTEGLAELAEEIHRTFEREPGILEWTSLVKRAYNGVHTLAQGTRIILNALLGDQGLLVLDADSPELKNLFKSQMRLDLFEGQSADKIKQQTEKLKHLGISGIIPARNCNFFLIQDGQRERIDRTERGFELATSHKRISFSEMEELVEQSPEALSPNVAMRPVYQESILPNLAYVAGPSETVYWFQLGTLFGAFNIPSPALVMRHSFALLRRSQLEKLEASRLIPEDLWGDEEKLKGLFTESAFNDLGIHAEIQSIRSQLEAIYEKWYKTKFPGLKQTKMDSDSWWNTLRKTEKEYLDYVTGSEQVNGAWRQIIKIRKDLYPNDKPQEREWYISQFLLQNMEFIKDFGQLPRNIKIPLFIGIQ